MPSTPLSTSDIIFPTQSLNLSSTLNSLRRSALSVHNRLSSIVHDSQFVCSVADAYNLPLVANERCGSWYIPPEKKAGSVYFKSTDGHMNEWSFSMRRLNLHFLDIVAKWNGAVVVDSTRRGKSMPDALSKTIPIWCCVMNRAIFPDLGPHPMYTPPQAVFPSEHSQIEKRIDNFVKQFKQTYTSPLDELRKKLQKPLRPLWVTQESTLPSDPPSFSDFNSIILCTASRRVPGGEVSEGGYIQGAADDHEAWANGLTPEVFWKNKETLLNTAEDDIPSLIAELLYRSTSSESVPVVIKPTTLCVASGRDIDTNGFDAIISCGKASFQLTTPKKHLHLTCRDGKLGSRDLRNQLTQIPKFMNSLQAPPGKIMVYSPTEKDLALGISLAVLCLFTSDDGTISTVPTGTTITKSFIRQRLTWLTTADPKFNPSRETLKSVNSFLMPDPSQSSSPTSPSPSLPPSNPPKLSLVAQAFQSLSAPKSWKLTRKLTSALPTHPSGTVNGTAKFSPCPPGSSEYHSAYLYEEEGEFVTDTGLRFNARRRYIYRLKKNEERDEISIFFFDDEKRKGEEGIGEKGEGIGGLFVEMGLLEFESTWSGTMRARNKESHLCIDDLYAASWRFGPGMFEKGGDGEDGDGRWWEVQYDVKGPKKDYTSWTRYSWM